MSQEQQSCLRFSLEESIWFKKGQELEELLSISLDPHITIQEQEQYILIRGSLDLTGEYLPSTVQELDEEEVNWDQLQQAGKFVQQVNARDKGECEFVHRFPVDVTIPKNRIANLGEIDVFVESFDYVVPENACLKLTADLTISGIYGEQQTVTPMELAEEQVIEPIHREATFDEEVEEEIVVENEQVQESTNSENQNEDYGYTSYEAVQQSNEGEFEPFAFEARKSVDEEVEEADLYVDNQEEVEEIEEEENEVPVLINYGAQNDKEQSERKENVYEMPEPELSESADVQEAVEENKPEIAEVEFEEEESSSSDDALLNVDVDVDVDVEVEVEKKPKIKKGKYESISLTDFFARKEEEQPAKMKVCIVQEGESLEYIAEKYEVQIAQLLRVNKLEANQDVYEGQVLYIPNDVPLFSN